MVSKDKDDEMTPLIDDDFGSKGFYARYDKAMELVSNRHSKGELISLVAYLLKSKE